MAFEFPHPNDSELSRLSAAELDELCIKNDINYLSMTEGLALTTDENGNTWIVATDSNWAESWDLWEAKP